MTEKAFQLAVSIPWFKEIEQAADHTKKIEDNMKSYRFADNRTSEIILKNKKYQKGL